jgi:hypothetical protein
MTTIAGIRSPVAWTGSTANMPTFTQQSTNSLLTLGPGSLVLINPSDASRPWSAGAPASGALLPNLAWDRAMATLGIIGDPSQVDCPYSNTLIGTGESIFERSAQGGLHGIVSQVSSPITSHCAIIRAAASVEAWLAANPNHSYYLSIWESLTRKATATQWPIGGIFKAAAQTANYDMYFQGLNSGATGVVGPAGGAKLGTSFGGANAYGYTSGLGTAFADIAVSSWSGTLPASDVHAYLALWGNVDNYGSLTANKSASKIFYQCYVEDLTVSGRTYAQVNALNVAAQTAAFGIGGVFYNDTTPTAPSALP